MSLTSNTALSGVVATGAGDPIGTGNEAKSFGVVVDYATAAPTAATVKLQGRIEGSGWVDLGQTTDVSATTVGFAVADKPYPEIRANLTAVTINTCTGITVKVSSGV